MTFTRRAPALFQPHLAGIIADSEKIELSTYQQAKLPRARAWLLLLFFSLLFFCFFSSLSLLVNFEVYTFG
jgi:hypothetical protein